MQRRWRRAPDDAGHKGLRSSIVDLVQRYGAPHFEPGLHATWERTRPPAPLFPHGSARMWSTAIADCARDLYPRFMSWAILSIHHQAVHKHYGPLRKGESQKPCSRVQTQGAPRVCSCRAEDSGMERCHPHAVPGGTQPRARTAPNRGGGTPPHQKKSVAPQRRAHMARRGGG